MSYAITSKDYWMFITVTEFKISYFNLHIFTQVFIRLHVGVIKEYYFSHQFHDWFFFFLFDRQCFKFRHIGACIILMCHNFYALE